MDKHLHLDKNTYIKYKLQINYMLFGIITVFVSIFSYHIAYHVLDIPNVISSIISWFLAVVAAYITNKIWVFESKVRGFLNILKEFFSFFYCRFLTGILEVSAMWIGVDILNINEMLTKVASTIIAIILNYLFSRLYIFNKR